ncbi:membrane dipeptidase [Vulcanisaeta distributa]|uniref:membrane dipeptidase n=1 Tax=Vulcanisaeta distributa TaxID=164451 RepID=UPI001FB4CAC8|nr:membrane dipeptidase [Vulcanisaeta distributa]
MGRTSWESRKPPEDLTNIGEIAKFLNKLAEYGMSDSDIRKIAFENALRVLRNNLS